MRPPIIVQEIETMMFLVQQIIKLPNLSLLPDVNQVATVADQITLFSNLSQFVHRPDACVFYYQIKMKMG
jgi:hypothetical protein